MATATDRTHSVAKLGSAENIMEEVVEGAFDLMDRNGESLSSSLLSFFLPFPLVAF